MVLGFIAWVKALGIVCLPFIKIAALWFSYQLGIGYVAWATARFYSTHCAGPGLNGFITSLFTMGSPICISAWISHAAFVVIYVTAFVAAVVFGVMWVWKRLTNDKTIKNLHDEINNLRIKLNNNLTKDDMNSVEITKDNKDNKDNKDKNKTSNFHTRVPENAW